MFEKETEEYADKKARELNINKCNLVYSAMQIAYRKGAEFGYNKANEWHYVKDGDLPKKQYDKVSVSIAYLNAFKNPCRRDCFYDGKDFVYWDSGKKVGWKNADIFGTIYAWKYADDFIPEPQEESE